MPVPVAVVPVQMEPEDGVRPRGGLVVSGGSGRPDPASLPEHRLYFCVTFAWFFRPVVPFENLLFIHASTNATDNHKYSPFPSTDFDSSEVLVSF